MTVTVKQLIAKLQEVEDKSLIVVMSRDSEGNGYSPLTDEFTTDCRYRAESTWSGELWNPEEKESDGSLYYFQEEIDEGMKDSVPALFLWPVN